MNDSLIFHSITHSKLAFFKHQVPYFPGCIQCTFYNMLNAWYLCAKSCSLKYLQMSTSDGNSSMLNANQPIVHKSPQLNHMDAQTMYTFHGVSYKQTFLTIISCRRIQICALALSYSYVYFMCVYPQTHIQKATSCLCIFCVNSTL